MKFTNYIEKLVKEKTKEEGIRKIAFIEGTSKRMIAAAAELKMFNKMEPILIFESKKSFEETKVKEGIEKIIIGEDKELFDKLVEIYVTKRKGKETREQAIENLKKDNYFAATLVEAGIIHGAIGGVHHPTSDILRAAFKSVGPKPGIKTVSSIMIMHRQDNWYIFSDISVNVSPTMEQIYEIAKNAYDFGDYIAFKKKIAFLSFSTAGSAITPESTKMREATEMFNKKVNPIYKAIGEVQFDAAFDLNIRKSKYKYDEGFQKMPTIFIFPSLDAGNIGYKIAQRMGSWGAIGPIITGLNKPINDLSRGATIEDIKYTAIITALQAFKPNKAHD